MSSNTKAGLTPLETDRPEPGDSTFLHDAAGVARGSALLFSSRVIGNAGFFVAVLLLARGLSVSDRGRYAFIATAALVIGRVAGFGVPDATTVFTAGRPERRGVLLANVLLFTGISALVTGALLGTVVLTLEGDRPADITDGELAIVWLGAACAAVAGGAGAYLTGRMRWRAQSIVTALTPWLYALVLVLVWVGPGLTVSLALVTWIGVQAVSAAGLALVSMRETPLAGPDFRLLRESIAFGLRSWVGSVTLLLNYRLVQILMGFLTTQAALGVYAVAVNASEILLILPSAVGTALIPMLARSDVSSRADRTLRIFRMLVLVTLPTIGFAAALGWFLVPAVFGSDYDASVVPFLVLVTGTIGFVVSDLFSSALNGSSRPGRGSLAPLAMLLVSIVLDIVLIPPYGATGAAIATSVAFLIGAATALVAYRTIATFSLGSLLPRRDDAAALRNVARDLLLRQPRASIAGASSR
jgi:O-antigen/teichoic acid export membrane protein